MWFIYALASALFQVLRNMVMKRLGHALDETINVWGRFVFILPFTGTAVLIVGLPTIDPHIWIVCVLFAITQIIATQTLSYGLKLSDISLVTALWKLSVIFLLPWGLVTLGERPAALGVVGVVVSVCGLYLLNVRRSQLSLWSPLVALVKDPGQRFTLVSAFFFAPSVVLMKKIVLMSDPFFATFIAYVFTSALITPYAIYKSGRHFRHVLRYWRGFVSLGAFAAVSTVFGSLAYELTFSTYVESIKQVEILFALGIGYFIFHERSRVQAIWPGALIMLAGLVMLKLWG
ncbi:MAG: EamA family transporter [Candidatus Lambdaproteobacteria bacterium]|nr:EamA family transporter [Candidatus Lambdaproteobacteria bacterium]